jgi:hypothetical protein
MLSELSPAENSRLVARPIAPAYRLVLRVVDRAGTEVGRGLVEVVAVARHDPLLFAYWFASLCCNSAKSRQSYFRLFLLRDPYLTARRSALAMAALSAFSFMRSLAFIPASL